MPIKLRNSHLRLNNKKRREINKILFSCNDNSEEFYEKNISISGGDNYIFIFSCDKHDEIGVIIKKEESIKLANCILEYFRINK